MNLVRFKSIPILQQLNLEERLLRTSADNWCIINDGTNAPNVVMGLSGRPSDLIELENVLRDRIPVIKRFTGGGTVIVDEGTIFVTFICNRDAIPGLQAYPQPIMSWTSQLYGEVLQGVGDFNLRENDYVFGNYKFGGNAQSITKNRWIHHTSFLWDFNAKNMAYLKLPTRAPKYRSTRQHVEFLRPMKDYLPARSTFIEKTITALQSHFLLRPVDQEAIATASNTTFPQSTRLLTNRELEDAFVQQAPDDSQLLTKLFQVFSRQIEISKQSLKQKEKYWNMQGLGNL